MSCPRLIEVALPIREISAESVRDKSLRHGHISTLHLWWARRPLAASRAVVFASVVPDPDDPACPAEFRAAVERHLKTHVPRELKHYKRGSKAIADTDPYKPYEGVPDTPRNRLLTFIAKWGPEALAFETGKTIKEPKPAELLDDRSLVKWETSDPKNPQGHVVIQIARDLIHAAHGGKAPTVLDPFSGGGAIPLEAGRLGCQPIANDYNPVAYLILKASCEYPQRFGATDKASPDGDSGIHMRHDEENPLARDVEKWTKWVLERARERIGHIYPAGKDGRPVVGYFWARTVPCSNPSCRGEIPLLRSLLLCNKSGKRVALKMDVDKATKGVVFGILKDAKIKETAGTMVEKGKGNVRCPHCDQTTPVDDVRRAGVAGKLGERMVAAIIDARGDKDYRPVEGADEKAFQEAAKIDVERPNELILPEINAADAEDDVSNSTGIRVHLYGMTTWGSLFNPRQLVAMQTFTACLHEALDAMRKEIPDEAYRQALATYLGLWLSRIAMFQTSVGRLLPDLEAVTHPFNAARMSMTWDYPETSPFAETSGGAMGQIDWMKRVIEHEAEARPYASVIRGDGAHLPVPDGSVDAVVTDPPYFDEAAYADLSDFFYVWLKRAIGDLVPEALATPQTPKSDEATALKHRHGGDAVAADKHFTDKLSAVFAETKRVTKPDGLFSIVFAHQETEAWTALVRSLFSAGITVDATWPIEMERKNRPRGINSAALETSITVICRPRTVGSAASYKEVRREIESVVAESVKRFWSYGFRGADLIVACYGPAVGVFGRHERVEKADGTPVEIPELLDLARRAAMDAIAGEFRGDNVSTLYYVWANLYGAGEQAWDDARLVVQIGGDTGDPMEIAHRSGVFVVDGAKVRLAMLADRAAKRGLGVDPNGPLIDALHRAMQLWKEEKRPELVTYLNSRGFLDNGAAFWKLAQALFEVLPRDSEDWKLVSALLTERQTLRTEAQRSGPIKRAEKSLEQFPEEKV